MPIYFLSLYAVLIIVLDKQEARYSAFLWGTFKGNPKKRWKYWNSMATSLASRGLKLRPLKEVMKSLGMK